MTVNYNRLWKLLIDKKMKKIKLQEVTKISSATLWKMTADKIVSLEVIGKICIALNCGVDDILEFIPDEK